MCFHNGRIDLWTIPSSEYVQPKYTYPSHSGPTVSLADVCPHPNHGVRMYSVHGTVKPLYFCASFEREDLYCQIKDNRIVASLPLKGHHFLYRIIGWPVTAPCASVTTSSFSLLNFSFGIKSSLHMTATRGCSWRQQSQALHRV